ncbi:helix-turn-helix domain-containing protein [Actinomadura verrucosospora]|nr:helix-turn-helix domain-containing protein [Actinomadura verrucosospora]
MTHAAVGLLIRRRRSLGRRSQMDLAHEIGVSPRHLSFVELGKSKPSADLLLAIARHLDVPLRERNDWLLAAGYAPRYPETSLTEPELARVRRSLQALLDAHDPFPAAVIDRTWSVQLSNRAARRLVSGIAAEVRGVPTNIFRTALHPAGLAHRTRNFPQWSAYLLWHLDRAVTRNQDPALTALAAEIATWQGIPERRAWGHLSAEEGDDPVVPWRLEAGGQELSLITTMSTFGVPMDVTLSELSIELFFPADETTEAALRRHADTGTW